VPECDDKPYKHPHIYRGLDALIRNKIGLLNHVRLDNPRCLSFKLGCPLERPSKGRSILSRGVHAETNKKMVQGLVTTGHV
jgi:hypothetical protein